MAIDIDLDNYIESKYREYLQAKPELVWDYQYAEFYKDIRPNNLQELLTVFHAELTRLFSLMNSRLPTNGDYGAHFWAEPSRELLSVVETVRALQRVLNNTEYAFCVDDYYEELLDNCSQWLSKSGGSNIPPHMEKVILYYKKPIFTKADGCISCPELHVLGEQSELIGRGGYGEVYKYRHPIVDVDFAVKIYNP